MLRFESLWAISLACLHYFKNVSLNICKILQNICAKQFNTSPKDFTYIFLLFPLKEHNLLCLLYFAIREKSLKKQKMESGKYEQLYNLHLSFGSYNSHWGHPHCTNNSQERINLLETEANAGKGLTCHRSWKCIVKYKMLETYNVYAPLQN